MLLFPKLTDSAILRPPCGSDAADSGEHRGLRVLFESGPKALAVTIAYVLKSKMYLGAAALRRYISVRLNRESVRAEAED